MKAIRADDYLAQATLLRLLALMAVVFAPHAGHVPAWEAIGVAALLGWRVLAAWRQWPLPPQWLKLALVFVAFGAVNWQFRGNLNSQNAGLALLVVMVALKLTEMRERRDVMVVMFLMYFMLFTHFLYSQEIWTIGFLLLCAIGITALLAEAHHDGKPLSPRVTLKLGTTMILHSLPLMAAIFVLFPRIPGPLWGLPSDAGAARSGLSDSMSPGDISRLIESDEIAFRVTFAGVPPPMRARYWRGPVFNNFNGRTWSDVFRGEDYFARSAMMKHPAFQPAVAELSGTPVAYEVTLEPHRQHWLFALDLPSRTARPAETTITGYYQLLSVPAVKERKAYSTESFTQYRLQPELSDAVRADSLQLPRRGHPRARALAAQWRAAGLDDAAVIERALRNYREEPFFYTLEPPALAGDTIDDFLFETRRGFCEHYASSFTVLMRAAGVPARVVTGYQGGELNEIGDYYVVRQSDAHAWSEVWLAERGWVRVDPTAAVAPNRIETGLSSALTESEGLPDFLQRGAGWAAFRYGLEARWDMANAVWNRWVLGYGPTLQEEVMAKLGLIDWQRMIIALTVLVVGMMSLVGLAVMRKAAPASTPDRAQLLWRKALRRLARLDFVQQPSEGPMDFAARVAAGRPDLAPALERLARAYVRWRYLVEPGPGEDAELKEALAALRP